VGRHYHPNTVAAGRSIHSSEQQAAAQDKVWCPAREPWEVHTVKAEAPTPPASGPTTAPDLVSVAPRSPVPAPNITSAADRARSVRHGRRCRRGGLLGAQPGSHVRPV